MNHASSPGADAPRLAPLPPSELSPYARQIFDNVGPGGAANLVATLAHQPELFERFLPVTLVLQNGELSWRHREMAILRLAYQRHCRYIWQQHVVIGLHAGITEDEVSRIVDDLRHSAWTAEESALLQAVDELVQDSGIGDTTWAALAAGRTPAQLVELTVLVGHYSGLAFLANSALVVPDADPPSDPRLTPW